MTAIQKLQSRQRWSNKYLKWGIVTGTAIVVFYLALIGMGRYLSMASFQQKCVAVIVEGGTVVTQYKMDAAIRLWQGGIVQNIIIVLNSLEDVKVFALHEYPRQLSSAIDSIGIPPERYHILSVSAPDPYTFHTAREVVDYLTQKKITSALIVHDQYHIRRSYLTYKKASLHAGIQIHPYTVMNLKDCEKWWLSSLGIRRVCSEYFKIIFYWINGYI